MKTLSESPTIDPSARVVKSRLGRYTEVMRESSIVESVMDDYSYCAGYNQIVYSDIGKFSNIASFVRINPGNHPQWRASQHHIMYRSAQYFEGEADDESFFDWRRSHRCAVGHDTWIGHGAVILPGAAIGDGAIVAAGAVVSKDVGPYEIHGGVPAKFIKRRHPESLAERLQAIAWWDWSHEVLHARLLDFRTLDAEEFAEKFG